MGYNLAGFATESGKARRALNRLDAGARTRQGCGRSRRPPFQHRAHRASPPSTRWRANERDRTLYLFDVRNPEEYAAGHLPGAISAPGGQLVQATDQYAGTLGARIVLVDEHEVRAMMTASWLKQMGWQDVFVLAETGKEKGWPAPPVLGHAAASSIPSMRPRSPSSSKTAKRPWSIFRSVRPTARATSRARGSRSARD